MIGFDNGLFRELRVISVPVTSLSINRGYGAFDFFEVINGKPFYGERHVERFERSLRLLKLTIDFLPRLPKTIEEIIGHNRMEHGYIKMFALPHTPRTGDSYQAALYIFPTEMPQYAPSLYEQGAHLTLKEFSRFLPEAKSTNYLAGQFWADEATDSGTVDILYHNGKTVQETSRGNIFIVKNGMVVTPKENILKGVTRSIVLDILTDHPFNYQEAEISLEDLMTADEVFLASTTKRIMPIVQIDGGTIGNGQPGAITRQIMEDFHRIREDY
ncbi:aminotransferase class IV [Prolixibacter denitrificans]|uniref:branched-chain-amino-acid transaminase n=1 Tax=Prolixibacter denitrificans TaxID=1541063 RepID=A0A2P8C7U3_9BACT|nr:aminotransferase class IV [Prolixibacter denitrificans]PSK81031.1 D-alanine transaminase/branched-chain amino acid aminotransferase [Prolixibacter denitrificans]GET22149.1 branched chain amino acid aminotransferase [Prolixibacter denitrificans]